jgi:hypothetical protein
MNGGQESAFDKNKTAALMNGNTHTTINIPQRVCSVAEQK